MKKILIIILSIISIFSLGACKEEVNDLGSFYSVERAYNEKLLSKSDLESIAYYHKYYLIMSTIPEPLSVDIENLIKEAWVLKLQTRTSGTKYPDATTNDVTISGYYGKYNNCYAVMLTDVYTSYTAALRNVEIDGVVFNYRDGNSILIWVQESKDK